MKLIENDYINKKYERLTIIKFVKNKRFVECKCDCGNVKDIDFYNLKRGAIKSCGCYNRELHSIHNKCETRLYRIRRNMKKRCYNKNAKEYNLYGGRGITVCEEWKNNFQSFYDWAMGNGYEEHLTIDRINNDGNYEPSNCRWTTQSIQTRNQRIMNKNKTGHKGVFFEKTRSKWKAYITINKKTIQLGRFNTIEEAIQSRKEAEQKYFKEENKCITTLR